MLENNVTILYTNSEGSVEPESDVAKIVSIWDFLTEGTFRHESAFFFITTRAHFKRFQDGKIVTITVL